MTELRNKSVIEKLADQCRECYIGRIPFIAVDTYDSKIINLLIEKRNIIDFYSKDNEKKLVRLGEDESVFEVCQNFHHSLADFKNFLNKKDVFYNVPHMFALRIADDEKKANESLYETLIDYVDYYAGKKDFSNCIILYGNIESLPREINTFTEVVKVDYPEIWEIKEIIKRVISEDSEFCGKDFENEGLDEVVAELSGMMKGFSLVEVEDITYKLLNLDCVDGQRVLFCNSDDNKDGRKKRNDVIFFKKQQALNYLGGILQLDKSGNNSKKREDKIVGFDHFDKWVDRKTDHVKNGDLFARERGSGSVRGLLLFGVPGCGKSASVKVLKEKLGLSVLCMDMGSLMGEYVGNSEKNMRDALRVAEESMAPCILFIDEIEKGFAATAKGSSKNDSVFLRMFAYMLKWMQEQKNVFIVMTSNDISSLPSEFLRSGRLSGLFAVQMPTASECVGIFKEMMHRSEEKKEVSLKQNGITGNRIFDDSCFDDNLLMEIVELAGTQEKFFVGADIEKIVDEAKDLNTVTINGKEEKIDYSKPLSKEEWKNMLISIVESDDINTFGMSDNNLYGVAHTYINLFHGGFMNVSENALFKKEDYKCEFEKDGDKIKVKVAEYVGKPPESSPEYDELLFKNIKDKINDIAIEIESNNIHKLISG